MGRFTHRRAASAADALRLPAARLPIEASLRARFLRRYKRFLADVVTEDGRELTVHCPNPGSMLGFHRPGAAVRCSTSDDPRRKLRHTLEMMRVGRVWVGLHASRANAVAARALAAGQPRELAGYATCTPEVRAGSRSRLDFHLTRHRRGRPDCWVEVKSVTLAESGVAMFPDSVTERGRRHLAVLSDLARGGERAAMLFLVQRADCHSVRPADEIDPDYGAALRAAARAGVELFALSARVTGRAITVERRLPVRL
jgi:sugar fermentation stimulation protein A